MIVLDGKVCLVTGAAGGIGKVIVSTLAGGGATVLAHHRPGDARVSAWPKGVLSLAADLADPAAPAALFREAIARAGRVDVLVNNAAIEAAAGIDDDLATWQAAWSAVLRVNLLAAADLSREALRHFTARGSGTFVNVASRAAFRGDTPEHMAYAASKAGLVALTRSIARGFADKGVLAYAVAPGFVEAGMAMGALAADRARIEAEIPLGAPAPASDVANVVAFLASGLAPHATGTTVDVNGASYVR